MNESPHQYFLSQAGTWLDLYGHFSREWHMRAIDCKINHLTRDPSDLADSLDLLKHLALYTGRLWRDSPEAFTGQVPDLVAPPTLEGIKYDKAVLENLIDRCARQPRLENTSLPAADYVLPSWDYDPLDYTPASTIENLTGILITYSEALRYETGPAELLNILLSAAWELYLRAWEHTNA